MGFVLLQFPWGKDITKLRIKEISHCNEICPLLFVIFVFFLFSILIIVFLLVYLYSPLTTLRDDVILIVQDAGGNEISRAGLF